MSVPIHEQIDAILDARGMTRSEFADKLGVSKAAVSNMLRPGHNFTIQRLGRIAEALDTVLLVELTSPD